MEFGDLTFWRECSVFSPSGSFDCRLPVFGASSGFGTLSAIVQSSFCSSAACVFGIARLRGAFGFSFDPALLTVFAGFSSFILTVRDACRVFPLPSVSIEAGVALVERLVAFTSGSGTGFAAVLERLWGCVFGTALGGFSSCSSDFAEALVRLFVAVFFVAAFGFSSVRVSDSDFFVLPRRAGALMPPPAAAWGRFSISFDCVCARVDTILNSTVLTIARICEKVQISEVSEKKSGILFAAGCPATG